MASIYKKQNSPFWFVQFIDTDGTRRNKSTGLRTDKPSETVKARALRAQLEAKELNRTAGEISGGGWDRGVLSRVQSFKLRIQSWEGLCEDAADGILVSGPPGQRRTLQAAGPTKWAGWGDPNRRYKQLICNELYEWKLKRVESEPKADASH